MPCTPMKFGDGTSAIICTRGRRREPCSVPGCTNSYEVLCDYPLAPLAFGEQPRTCDKKLCRRCAKHVGPNRDLCPVHAKMEADAIR